MKYLLKDIKDLKKKVTKFEHRLFEVENRAEQSELRSGRADVKSAEANRRINMLQERLTENQEWIDKRFLEIQKEFEKNIKRRDEEIEYRLLQHIEYLENKLKELEKRQNRVWNKLFTKSLLKSLLKRIVIYVNQKTAYHPTLREKLIRLLHYFPKVEQRLKRMLIEQSNISPESYVDNSTPSKEKDAISPYAAHIKERLIFGSSKREEKR